MLVNASQFPGPALWQGCMLILVVLWSVWLFRASPSDRAMKWSVVALVVIGVALAAVIIGASI